MKQQRDAYKYDIEINGVRLKNCEDFDLDLRFIYYYDKELLFPHILIERRTLRKFVDGHTYNQMVKKYEYRLPEYHLLNL